MSITTTYKCDCCSHEQDIPEQMWKVFIGYEHVPGWTSTPSRAKEELWCRSCMEKYDLLIGAKNPKEQTPPFLPPTLEDIIRELCREEITNLTGAS